MGKQKHQIQKRDSVKALQAENQRLKRALAQRDKDIAHLLNDMYVQGKVNLMSASLPGGAPLEHIYFDHEVEHIIERTEKETRAAVAELFKARLWPMFQANAALNDVITMVLSYAPLTANPDRRFVEIIRKECEPLPAELAARFTEFLRALEQNGGHLVEGEQDEITEGQIALFAFVTGKDNGEKLREWSMGKGLLTDRLAAALQGIDIGGAPRQEYYAWLGQHVSQTREKANAATWRQAVEHTYSHLISLERDGHITPVERDALTELDTRDNDIFRRQGRMSDRAVTYARNAARKWEQRQREQNR